MKRSLGILVLIVLAATAARAHHGRDFLVTSSYRTPEQGDFFAVLSSDYVRFNHHGESGYELSPAMLYGITDAWSVEFHTHHGFDGGGTHLETIALESVVRLMSEQSTHGPGDAPFSLAFLAEYGRGMNDLPDAAEGRIVVGKELGVSAAALNVIVEKQFEEGDDVEVRFAGGLRTMFLPALGAGLEMESNGEDDLGAMLTPGIYTSIAEHFDVRLGVSVGLEHQTLNAVRSQFIYSF